MAKKNNDKQLGFNFETNEIKSAAEEKALAEEEARIAKKKIEAEKIKQDSVLAEEKKLKAEISTLKENINTTISYLEGKYNIDDSEDEDDEESVEKLDAEDKLKNNINMLKNCLKNIDSMGMNDVNALNARLQDLFDKAKKAKKKFDNRKKEDKIVKHEYPFTLHFAGQNIETDHIFENGKKYTEEEIRTKMLEHRYYEFSGQVSFEYLKEDNVLLPIFHQHKKG